MKTTQSDRAGLLSAAAACEKAATASPDDIQSERLAMSELIKQEHTIKAALMAQKMKMLGNLTLAGCEEKRKPIQIEGEDWAYVESRMPAEMWWHLYKQPNYGWDGLRSDSGQRELKKAYPVFFPKQVSGKIQVGWRGNVTATRSVKVKFDQGTINFAK